MKDVSGRARLRVAHSVRRCFTLLEALEQYPEWLGEYLRSVEVLEQDRRGRATLVRASVHVEQSPFGKDFELVLAAAIEPPGTIRLSRVIEGAEDADRLELSWRLRRDRGTVITAEFQAQISLLPSLLPVGDAGDAIARGALKAAAAALAERTPEPTELSR